MGQLSPSLSLSGSRRAVFAAGAGTLIQGYDSLLYGYFATVFAKQFFPPGDPTAALLSTFAIFAVGFAVRPLGGIVFGHVGDRLGRRTALIASILMMATATPAIGLLPTYQSIGAWAPVLLLMCRLLQGFSVGGEYIGANVLILEHASAGWSGRSVSVNQIAGYLGISAAATTSLVLSSNLSAADLAQWGWRLPFFAALPLGLIGLYLRLRISDSPEFTAAKVKRLSFPLGTTLRTAWRGLLIYGAWFAMVGLGGYMLHGYMASYLIRVVGLNATGAFAASLAAVIALAAGAMTGGYLVDRYPPYLVAIASASGIAVLVVPGFLLTQRGSVGAAILGLVPWAACLGIAATFGATLTVVLFPVQVRYTATAFAHNVTVTLFGSTAPYVSTWLVDRVGSPFMPAWYLVVMALIAIVVAVFVLKDLAARPIRPSVTSVPGAPGER
ncbi:MAG TPA: MFS transporter [Kineosporiaceae bacterium]|nr:MFS transporter [Kineosporiaceae bacterium]